MTQNLSTDIDATEILDMHESHDMTRHTWYQSTPSYPKEGELSVEQGVRGEEAEGEGEAVAFEGEGEGEGDGASAAVEGEGEGEGEGAAVEGEGDADGGGFVVQEEVEEEGKCQGPILARLSTRSMLLKRWRPLIWLIDDSCELRLFRMNQDLDQYQRVNVRLREARRCLRDSTSASRALDATAKERREAKIATTRMLSVVRSLEDTLELMDDKGSLVKQRIVLTVHHRVTGIVQKRYNLDGVKKVFFRFKLVLETSKRGGDYGASSTLDGPESPPVTPTGKRKPATKSVASAYFSALEEQRVEALRSSIVQSLKMLSGDITDDEGVEEEEAAAAVEAHVEGEVPETHFPPVEPSELPAAIDDPSKQSDAFPTIVADPTAPAGASSRVDHVFGTDEMQTGADADADATDLAAYSSEGGGSPSTIHCACDDFRIDIRGAAFGLCVCGFASNSHQRKGAAPTSPRNGTISTAMPARGGEVGFVAGARVVSATPTAGSGGGGVWNSDRAAADQSRAEATKQQEEKRAEVADQQERARAEAPAMAPTSDPKLEALRSLAKSHRKSSSMLSQHLDSTAAKIAEIKSKTSHIETRPPGSPASPSCRRQSMAPPSTPPPDIPAPTAALDIDNPFDDVPTTAAPAVAPDMSAPTAALDVDNPFADDDVPTTASALGSPRASPRASDPNARPLAQPPSSPRKEEPRAPRKASDPEMNRLRLLLSQHSNTPAKEVPGGQGIVGANPLILRGLADSPEVL